MHTEQTQRSARIDSETSERGHRQSCLCGLTQAAAQWVEALRVATGPSPAQGQLESWVAEPGQGEQEDRREAVSRVRAWQEVADVHVPLNLASLALTTLPVLPPEMQGLSIMHNRLSSLSIEGQANLLWLDASNNLLTSLSDAFPAGLQDLNVSGNRVSGLPAAFPAGLRRLNLSNNRLTSLTDTLPATLQQLDASNNQVTDLPEALPAGLRRLNLSNNRLTSLTDTLPPTLQQLEASNNQVTSLPAAFPAGLRRLDLRNNQLTSLPETLPTQLGSECRVQLENNPLPERVLTNLASTLNSQDYAGPQIFFSVHDGAAQDQARPLCEAVAAWLPNEPNTAALWRAFAEEPGAKEYARFLDRLLDTVNSSNSEFRVGVADDLRQAAIRPGLRAQYFQSAIGASASCQDRITLAWNDMQTARLNADVEEGAYDGRLDKLVEQGRVMFRLGVLDGIARDKVSSLRFVDEIEVYLAYQVKLRDRLDLKHIAPAMRYFGVAHVDEHDLATAEAVVRSKEAAEFADYLATSWQPWDTVLRRIAPEAHAEMQDRLVDAMGEEFESRLTERLTDLHLNGDADAERQLGAKIRDEIAREINGALTRQVLGEHGLTLQPAAPTQVARGDGGRGRGS
ncbi:leucine-rich repeat domain-containing protein [Bradyrhizobium sp. 24]|uniref:NEL-type E3 ubiquitin ligase domain-containing protein n=1 Tax=unclassified Bradyrhizobium TaxID=2631580 RepID=UPI001FF87CD5|nr:MULTISPECIES: NEL-type E3 ubiquitin ligase domain-containing protein [unclassified Bradyrhizobium]MCK1377536.1 leucine-rich repeat domain-containing protein [Bradyrhizobium sp. 24]MCK1296601.1 leucine-rich repeat domain-containing protein [Bradyrhizobium sp. 37]MCK1317590.1 leucine-rich repeat domain-containing protein [Bradyrhizobium sp. 23]MCK1406643.1 leucine-rich repeat domain-containing protein [Bradyrhizobium sp. 76]MCK1478498.1 leucine-rich repeat domain-containing protein [Bradyrhiz